MTLSDMFPEAPALTPMPCPPEELIDEMLACYAEWREEVATVDETYRRWCVAPNAERDLYFGVYLAALDQEESAAMLYAVVAQQVSELLHANWPTA
jgi:hypothetical protein